MNRQVAAVMREAEGRYLSQAEIDSVLETVRGFERRVAIMRKIEAKEKEIILPMVEAVFNHYPDFSAERPQAFEKCVRDETLVLRYCAMAMVNGDAELLREKLLYWMQTVLASLDFDKDFIRFTYETMQEHISRALAAEEAAEINPYIDIVIAELTK